MTRKNTSGPSMVDVAREAGVSLKTVSRVVNEPGTVRTSTREAVEAAMSRLGFRTNYAARSLKLGSYKTVGLVFFELKGGEMSVLRGITSAAADNDYAITLLTGREGEQLTLGEASRRMSTLAVDAMIFNLGQMVEDFETYHPPTGLKTVIVTPFEHAACTTVSDDQTGASKVAVERLIELGHREIRFIAGPDESLASRNRESGWREALQVTGLRVVEPERGDWGADSGYEAGARLAQDANCTAVLAGNDHMALGAMQALRDAGKQIPVDVSVIGFDDSLEGVVPNAQLSSIRFNHAELGARALEEALLADTDPRRILVQPTLIERASIGMPLR
ncbi:LacI family DNA-binding transcriptional regulator [Paratractidigestivibacter sp.]|uniref:LacI family DNA-binding transcriptional regulator n=1 Tax=Paratractidigestivibacter sp. TaxID=2847316 RepID=UPI002AC95E80|nr:LacI family DNA-binding transcriptional regulator [Paratractidigestivibacter sp.]